MSTGRKYTRGIRWTFSYLTHLMFFSCMLLVILTSIDPFFLIVNFKPPVINPLMVSSNDLFKRPWEEKSTDTETSKAPLVLSSLFSPPAKKTRNDPSSVSTPDHYVPLVSLGHTVDAKPSSFAHFLDDILLPQAVECHSSKSIVWCSRWS